MSANKDRLADILEQQELSDDEDIDGPRTPDASSSGSLDQRIRKRLMGMTESELETFVKQLRATEGMQAAFDECLSRVQAVDSGVNVDATMEVEAGSSESSQVKRVKTSQGFHGRKWSELARFIPLRLTGEERRILAILDRTLKVSEYTDNVDIYASKRDRTEVIRREIKKIESVLSGQFIAMKMSKSTASLTEDWFKEAFEIGRRYKAMNPDRLRETYVKLMYMLQDSRSIGEYAEWSQESLKTVATALELAEIDKADFLSDPLVDEFVVRNNKEALSALVDKFLIPPKARETLELIVHSIKDYYLLINSYLDPINSLLDWMKTFFPSTGSPDGRFSSLAIRGGENGSRLTHSHPRQVLFVSQSLRLWREVLMYFMPIWFKAEEDLLSGQYRLADTGQGLNRVQSAPACSKLMHQILDKVQRDLDGNWIGSSVVHMGDHTVPNALMFLDKYCQIPRILGPVAHTVSQLEKEYKGTSLPPVVRDYIDSTFGGVEMAQRAILCDFFKHSFDGSGADNAYDAGSCIDGRLTSSWNWCSKIEKKAYFPLFLLTNFIGFDGQHGW